MEERYDRRICGSYGTADGAVYHHTVWLYTRADCGSISWTLGGKTHSEPLACGTATGFMVFPKACTMWLSRAAVIE